MPHETWSGAATPTVEPRPPHLLYLMNDFVVQEHVCNLRCSYCLNFENVNLKDGAPWVPMERIDLNTGSYGWQRARQMLARCRELGDAPILRFAGGEIMAVHGSLAFIEEEAEHWDRVQVLTNATFLERDIERLRKIPSLNLCCSVDGHTAELNEMRTPNRTWAQRIINGMLAAIDAGVPVEVYTVLTQHNAPALYEFADWLLGVRRTADVRLFPFPVRGDVGHKQRPTREQYAALARVIEDYDRLSPILPPKGFLLRLYDFCMNEVRRFRCRVPLSFQQTFDDGVVASCSNCWASPLGNLLEDEHTFDQVGRANIHKLFLQDPPRFAFCKTCFTPFDVVNTYLDGLCTLDEMASLNLYSSPAARQRLQMMREAWSDGSAQALWS